MVYGTDSNVADKLETNTKADELADALEEQCEILAWPTHVIHDCLEHPERFECGDFGIRRKGRP